jgi:hypothetical protein
VPFTPLHLGPGAVFKSLGRDRFSFMLFGLSQVAIDIEPLVRIYAHANEYHGFFHTLLGATLVGAIVLPLGKPLTDMTFRFARTVVDGVDRALIPTRVSWFAAAVGTFVGVWSHVFIDAIMHADVKPWGPWSERNPLLGLVSIGQLNVGCLVLAAFGMVFWLVWYVRARRRHTDG